MSILLTLLKIIAIILAVILGFLLLCLFHPVFYQINGKLEEEWKPLVKGSFWWLFRILRVEFQLAEGDLALNIRIFGFKINLAKEKSHEEPLGEEPDFSDREETELKEQEEQTIKEEPKEEQTTREESKEEQQTAVHKEKKKRKRKKKKEKSKKTKEKKEKTNIFQAVKRELSDEKNKLAVSHVWREVIYLFSHIKPKTAVGEINFSTGDPALTGQATGVLSLMPVFYRYKLHVYPDFAADKFYIQGYLTVKGHMALYHLVLILVRLFCDKNIRGLINKIRK